MRNEWKTLGLGFSSIKRIETLVSVLLGFLRADFDNLLNICGLRSQLGSCSAMHLVRPFKVSDSLGQWNDLREEFSAKWSVLATRACTINYAMKENDFEEVPN